MILRNKGSNCRKQSESMCKVLNIVLAKDFLLALGRLLYFTVETKCVCSCTCTCSSFLFWSTMEPVIPDTGNCGHLYKVYACSRSQIDFNWILLNWTLENTDTSIFRNLDVCLLHQITICVRILVHKADRWICIYWTKSWINEIQYEWNLQYKNNVLSKY